MQPSPILFACNERDGGSFVTRRDLVGGNDANSTGHVVDLGLVALLFFVMAPSTTAHIKLATQKNIYSDFFGNFLQFFFFFLEFK